MYRSLEQEETMCTAQGACIDVHHSTQQIDNRCKAFKWSTDLPSREQLQRFEGENKGVLWRMRLFVPGSVTVASKKRIDQGLTCSALLGCLHGRFDHAPVPRLMNRQRRPILRRPKSPATYHAE